MSDSDFSSLKARLQALKGASEGSSAPAPKAAKETVSPPPASPASRQLPSPPIEVPREPSAPPSQLFSSIGGKGEKENKWEEQGMASPESARALITRGVAEPASPAIPSPRLSQGRSSELMVADISSPVPPASSRRPPAAPTSMPPVPVSSEKAKQDIVLQVVEPSGRRRKGEIREQEIFLPREWQSEEAPEARKPASPQPKVKEPSVEEVQARLESKAPPRVQAPAGRKLPPPPPAPKYESVAAGQVPDIPRVQEMPEVATIEPPSVKTELPSLPATPVPAGSGEGGMRSASGEMDSRGRRLYLVKKNSREERYSPPAGREGPKEIAVSAPPELAEQEGFDTMVKDVYTQLKAGSAKADAPVVAVPPSRGAQAEKKAEPQEKAKPGLFGGTAPASIEVPPSLPAPSPQSGLPGTRDLFGELAAVASVKEPAPQGKAPGRTEQVQFVEMQRERGMGCPNCRAESTRIVFCPYCGSGMCANCSPNIRPEEDFFVYTCPRCGEEINVKKKQ